MSRAIFIYFADAGLHDIGGEARDWVVLSRRDNKHLGRITLCVSWGQYAFNAECRTIWSAGCLEEVVTHMRKLQAVTQAGPCLYEGPPNRKAGAKTLTWDIFRQDGALAARVYWWSGWRQYVLEPVGGGGWRVQNVQEMATFLRAKNMAQKKAGA